MRDVPADDPAGVRDVLTALYEEIKDDYNMEVGPFGTKSQTVGLYLFHRDHPAVQVIYSFPSTYTRSYLQRQPGETMLLPASWTRGNGSIIAFSQRNENFFTREAVPPQLQ